VTRPVRELRAFRRVHLEAGETARVQLEVPMAELAYWDEAARGWVVEDTDYVAWVGASSRELPLSAEFKVQLG
jgi:beta-glucosidase